MIVFFQISGDDWNAKIRLGCYKTEVLGTSQLGRSLKKTLPSEEGRLVGKCGKEVSDPMMKMSFSYCCNVQFQRIWGILLPDKGAFQVAQNYCNHAC